MTILLVDDDRELLRALRRFLTEGGHAVILAEGGIQGLKRLDEQHVDLAFCDARMPGIDGLAFLRAARERHPDTIVVMMTGEREAGQVVKAFREGAFDYLLKPIRTEELQACIEKVEKRGRQG